MSTKNVYKKECKSDTEEWRGVFRHLRLHGMTADLIIKGASALTMNPDFPTASAVAIADGRILAVGDDDAVMAQAGPATRIIDAKGATLLPGFVEAHMHLFGGGASLRHLLLTGTKGFDAICDKVRAYAADNPDTKVLYVRGVDYDMLDGTPFDRHILDRIIADRPLAFVAFDFHTMWANTLLLTETGLLQGKELGPGNEIVMADDGLATGELREVEAFGPINVYSGEERNGLGLSTGGEPDPAPTPEERAFDKADLRAGLDWCARHGITSIHNMDGNLYTLDLLKEIEAEGDLPCRVKVPFHFKNFMGLEMLEKASMMHDTYQGDWVTSGLVKAFCDGVMEGFTGYLVDDYADRPGNRGEPLFTEEKMTEMMVEADRRGLQIAVHSCGDGAVRQPSRLKGAGGDRVDAAAAPAGRDGFPGRARENPDRAGALASGLCLAADDRRGRACAVLVRLAGGADRRAGRHPRRPDMGAVGAALAPAYRHPARGAGGLHHRRRLCRTRRRPQGDAETGLPGGSCPAVRRYRGGGRGRHPVAERRPDDLRRQDHPSGVNA